MGVGMNAAGEWSAEHVATLWRMKQAGASLAEIAVAVGRSKGAVATKWSVVTSRVRGRKQPLKGIWYGAGTRAEGEGRLVRSARWTREALGSLVGCSAEMCTHVVTAE
jgi:hypothetical protein